MKSNVIIGVLFLGLVGLVGFVFTRPTPDSQPFGAATQSLDNIESGLMGRAGLQSYNISLPFTATSSVVCSLLNPFSSTSTIDQVGITVLNGVLGASNKFDLSTSTTVVGSSTPALAGAETMPLQGGVYGWKAGVYSSSTASTVNLLPNANTQNPYILKPNERINVRLATSSTGGGTFATPIQGRCTYQLSRF